MSKLYRSLLWSGALAAGVAACGDDVTVTPPAPPPAPTVHSVSVGPTGVTIQAGTNLQMVASVNADATVPTTVTWSINVAATVASIGATSGLLTTVAGQAAQIAVQACSTANTSVCGNATVTVATAPVAGVTQVLVTPAQVTLLRPASGDVLQSFSAAVVGSNNPSQVVTWAIDGTTPSGVSISSTTGVVTVNASAPTGLINVKACSTVAGFTGVCGFAALTISAAVPATISIQQVTFGLNNTPIVLNNVFGQIEILSNFNPGGQTVCRIEALIGSDVGATQVFASNPAAGPISLSINTAEFTENPAGPDVTVKYLNGQTTISTRLVLATNPTNDCSGATSVVLSTNTLSNVTLNNVDGWSADITKPANSANSAAGITFWGGPGAGGLTTAIVYPVIYNAGRNGISTATWTLARPVPFPPFFLGCPTVTVGPLASSNGGKTTQGDLQTFGYGVDGATVDCTSYENIGTTARDNIRVTAAIDGVSNGYPVVNGLTPLIPNTVVFGATPDSLRLDYLAPSVSTPSIARTTPAVTGWVNAPFSFINFASTDAGVGLRAVRDRATQWSSINCPGVVATNAAMPTGTGADINGTVACPTNFIGGTPGLGGTAPWVVQGTESDRLNNLGTSGTTPTFGTDYTNPALRWGLVHAAPALPAAYGGTIADPVDSMYYAAKPTPGTNEFRAEYLDERSGFYNAGQPDGFGVAAQTQMLSTANHINPTGACLIAAPGSVIGASFVTNPGCTLTPITVGQPFVRLDGWQPGERVDVPTAEGYYGYRTDVTDAAGNTATALLRRVLVNTLPPFSTGLGVPAVLTSTVFNFIATFSDSAENSHQSLQLTYPNIPTTDSVRYSRSVLALSGQPGCGAIALAAYMDNCISSPFAGNITPVWGNGLTPLATQTPYARAIEIVDATAFPASNVDPLSGSAPTSKPTKVQTWAWNWGGAGLPGGFPTEPGNGVSTPSAEIAIPALNVQNGLTIVAWNAANPTIAINHWRVIPLATTANQFGSIVPLRAQAVSPTNAPNPPFARVDFYRLSVTFWSYLGSVTGTVLATPCSGTAVGVCPSDQGTYRSWIYQLPNASFVNAWNTAAIQSALVSGNHIIAVGVTGTGDALVTLDTTIP